MLRLIKLLAPYLGVAILAICSFCLYYFNVSSGYLNFSDSVKYAEAGKNLALDGSYALHHSFFAYEYLENYQPSGFVAEFSPFNSYLLGLIFLIFPVSDQTIVLTGALFFIITALFIFQFARREFSTKVGYVAVLLFVFNKYFLEYAFNFSTEITFTLEVIVFAHLWSSKRRWLCLIPLLAMYFTRPQFWPFIAAAAIGVTLEYVFEKTPYLPRLTKVLAVVLVGILALLVYTHGNVVSLAGQFSGVIRLDTSAAQGLALRGSESLRLSYSGLVRKVFYNIYNFAKDSERLAPTGIFIFYLVSLFQFKKAQAFMRYHLLTLLVFSTFLLTAALTLPNARYVHPVMPLIFVLAAGALVKTTRLLMTRYSNLALALVVGFILFANVGYLTIDTRFRNQHLNFGLPPAYVQISALLSQNTEKGQVIITNLDAWAAWYQELSTMWYPVNPQMLEQIHHKVKYIALTDYNTQDADFSLGEWSPLLNQPDDTGSELIEDHYLLKGEYFVPSKSVFENTNYKLVIYEHLPQDN